ncbi:hypothetical protein AURDEDRAFT_125296 [Auricularia subglabra TFB-10046 SS5]|nr:hypothetical protein AURDEDRAFT_125296 [Auricularia subglabra TFB-10046 SS5]
MIVDDGMRACDGEGDDDFRSIDSDFSTFDGCIVQDGDDFDSLVTRDDEARMKLSFELWTDVSSAEELGDPAEIYRVIKQLRKIEREWLLRQTAKAAEIKAWSAAVAAMIPRETLVTTSNEKARDPIQAQPVTNP